jgi:uncharacterized membrane protein
MRKQLLILIVLMLFTISIVGLLVFGFDGGGFGKGMGVHGDTDNSNVRSLSLILFVVPLILAVGMIGYAVTFPNIEEQKREAKLDWTPTVENQESALDAVLRVLDEDEKKVMEVLADAENKTMLQKDIRWKTGFSRVKTHRVLYRVAKRGIITVEKYYNTNKVALAEWLTKEK